MDKENPYETWKSKGKVSFHSSEFTSGEKCYYMEAPAEGFFSLREALELARKGTHAYNREHLFHHDSHVNEKKKQVKRIFIGYCDEVLHHVPRSNEDTRYHTHPHLDAKEMKKACVFSISDMEHGIKNNMHEIVECIYPERIERLSLDARFSKEVREVIPLLDLKSKMGLLREMAREKPELKEKIIPYHSKLHEAYVNEWKKNKKLV